MSVLGEMISKANVAICEDPSGEIDLVIVFSNSIEEVEKDFQMDLNGGKVHDLIPIHDENEAVSGALISFYCLEVEAKSSEKPPILEKLLTEAFKRGREYGSTQLRTLTE